jgi:hypothetical protein
MVIKGRGLVFDIPKEIVITRKQIAESLLEPVANNKPFYNTYISSIL